MKKRNPPRLGQWLLRILISRRLFDEIEGDLRELFHLRVERSGLFKAKLFYCLDTLTSVRNLLLHRDYKSKKTTNMFRSNLRIAFRNFVKHKSYSLINVAGLSLGITCCLLITNFIKDDVTFDQFHKNVDNIYLLKSEQFFGDDKYIGSHSSIPLGPGIHQNLPEIEGYARLYSEIREVRSGEDKPAGIVETAYRVDPSFLSIFDFPIISGATATDALASPTSIAITKSMALRHFGNYDVVGKNIQVNINNEWKLFQIKAVLKNVPVNSTFKFDFLVPTDWEAQAGLAKRWDIPVTKTMILAKPGVDIELLTTKINEVNSANLPDYKRGSLNIIIEPFKTLHFSDTDFYQTTFRHTSDLTYSYLLSGVTLVILIMACVNFTNLSIARAIPRTREVGIRKVVGARKKQLITQFLTESLLVTIISFLLALGIAQLSLPAFERVTQKEYAEFIVSDPFFVLVALLTVIAAAVVSGLYPALVISRLNIVSSLKKGGVKIGFGNLLSKVLIVFQFAVSVLLIIGALTMNKQIDFMVSADKGYDDTNIIGVALNSKQVRSNSIVSVLKNNLLKNKSVLNVTSSSEVGMSMFNNADNQGNNAVYTRKVDADFIPLMKLRLIEGRNFDQDAITNGSSNIIVNQAFVEKMKWGDNIVGRTFKLYEPSTVIGVVSDFNFQSLQEEVQPLVLHQNANSSNKRIWIKYEEGQFSETVHHLEDVWSQLSVTEPLDYFSLPNRNISLYDEQVRWKSILNFSSAIAVFIACIGLLGLTYLSTIQRSKEIGIRKALGASISSLMLICSRTFSSLIFIAILIAIPLAYYGTERWLEEYAFRIDTVLDIFVIGGVINVLIALVTIGSQSYRIARSNLIKVLRSD